MNKHEKVFHESAGTHKVTSNIDMNNSGDSRVDANAIQDFGLQRKGKTIQFSTPIQPVMKNNNKERQVTPGSKDNLLKKYT